MLPERTPARRRRQPLPRNAASGAPRGRNPGQSRRRPAQRAADIVPKWLGTAVGFDAGSGRLIMRRGRRGALCNERDVRVCSDLRAAGGRHSLRDFGVILSDMYSKAGWRKVALGAGVARVHMQPGLARQTSVRERAAYGAVLSRFPAVPGRRRRGGFAHAKRQISVPPTLTRSKAHTDDVRRSSHVDIFHP